MARNLDVRLGPSYRFSEVDPTPILHIFFKIILSVLTALNEKCSSLSLTFCSLSNDKIAHMTMKGILPKPHATKCLYARFISGNSSFSVP